MIGYRDVYDYCGFVNSGTVGTDFFILHLNELDMSAANVNNSYLDGFTKWKIYTMSGTHFV